MQRSFRLNGVRVLDFTQVMAGPFCASLLAALGAEVIKVESTARPDAPRVRGVEPDIPVPTGFHTLNHSKRSITLNLGAPGGAELALRLIADCDVVLTAFRPGVLEKFGLDYEHARQVRDDIIMVSVSGYGQRGPYAKFGAYAAIFAAMGGASYLTGYRDGLPTEWRASVDLRVGTVAFASTLAALYRRQRTGRGGHVDLAGRDVVSMLVGDALIAQQSGNSPSTTGNEDRIMAPHQVFATANAEEWVALAVGSEAEWQAFCDVSGLTALRDDDLYSDMFRRWKHRTELHGRVAEWMRQQDAGNIVARLQAAGVSATPSYRMDQLLQDEHLIERNFWASLDVPLQEGTTKTVNIPGAPWVIDGSRGFFSPRPGVVLGCDNDHVYRDIVGLSGSEYRELKEAGVIS